MKIVTNTPDRLVLRELPLWGGIATILTGAAILFAGIDMARASDLWGYPVALFGPVMMIAGVYYYFRETRVIFDRAAAQVEIQVRALSGQNSEILALAHVKGLVPEAKGHGKRRRARLMLLVDDGIAAVEKPLTETMSIGLGHDRVLRAVNDWLAAPAP